MYTLKQQPEDFIVREQLSYTLSENGNYTLYLLKKINRESMSLFAHLARELHSKLKDIGYCGIKDKHAITEQYITLPTSYKKRLPPLDNCVLTLLGHVDEPLHLGDLDGNSFEIVIRNLDTKKKLSVEKVPNYFGEQRFSTQNAAIGKALITNNFDQALTLLKNDNQYGEQIIHQLEKEPTNILKAIQVVPRNVLKFYVHAYQSLLWNKAASRIIQTNPEQRTLPVLGFASELDNEFEEVYEGIMDNEEITQRSFIIRQYPELSSEGSIRDLYLSVSDFSYHYADDDLQSGKKKCIAKFTLGKGNYATTLIAHWFEEHH